MDNSKNVLWATGAVIVCVAGIIFGYNVRAHSEMGFASPGLGSSTLLASNDPNDNTISEGQYFYEITQLLRHQYVDPIDPAENQKLASGAVRGMVNSLLDPDSQYFNKDQYDAYQRNQKGVYEGIGAEIRFAFNEKEVQKIRDGETNADPLMLLPEVLVETVLPGSPAEKAGLKPGDLITAVNDKSIVTFKDIEKIRSLQTAVTDGKATKQELDAARKVFEERAKNNIATNKAREHLVVGTSGTVKVSWMNNGAKREATITKAETKVAPVAKLPDGTLAIRFVHGIGKALTEANVTDGARLDLRGGPTGNTEALLEALQAVAPAGTYGLITKEEGQTSVSVTTRSGAKETPRLTVRIDDKSPDVAVMFAAALQSKGYATVEGQIPDRPLKWVVDEQLPDGSGYTLLSGFFTVQTDTGTVSAAKVTP